MILFFSTCKKTSVEPPTEYVEVPEDLIPYFYGNPAWHPAGKWIAVEHGDSIDINQDGLNDKIFSGIWLIDSETAEKKPLIERFSLPSWSPDGNKLALVLGAQIFTIDIKNLNEMPVDTSNLTQLTISGRNFYPDWSYDAQKIAYSKSICEGPMTCGTWYTNLQSNEHNFVVEYGRYPNWNPLENSLIYITRSVSLSGEILGDSLFSANIETGSKSLIKYLHGDNVTNRYIKYSPNSQQIAFCSKPIIGPTALWIMDYDGSNLQKVSPEYAHEFDWSPDGTKLIYLFWDFLEDHPGNGHLWLMNSDGSGVIQLTKD